MANGRPTLEYYSIRDAYDKDYRTFQEACKDSEYVEKTRPNELAFMDVENIQMTIDYDYWVVRNGKQVTEQAHSFE